VPRTEAVARFRRDVMGIADAFQDVADAGVGWGVKLGQSLGDVILDLGQDLVAARSGKVAH
jgi:hypothetical protein